MKSNLLLLLLFVISFSSVKSQLPNGSIAPDFTARDINGIEYNLYDILAEGKTVVLDFSATWCGPCWRYHNSGTLHDFMSEFGPDGTDEVMAFYIESDINTTMEDLNGNTQATQGNWVTGTNYPIIDEAFIHNQYLVNSFPTIYLVCPDRRIRSVRNASTADLKAFSNNCPSILEKPEVSFSVDKIDGCNSLDVAFFDTSWPRADSYNWNFGDGESSTDRNPIHNYAEAGNYTVSLAAENNFGETELIKDELISVGEGDNKMIDAVGPSDKNIGSGRYFPGGHQALIFDVMEDMVLQSVKVFSDLEKERTIALWDKDGVLINKKYVLIPEGEHRIDLNMFIPVGSDYQLGLYSDASLFRNDGGVQYPYTVDNLVSITKSTAGMEPLKYYYYFYEWNVRPAGCQGPDGNDELSTDDITIFPTLVIDHVEVITKSKSIPVLHNSLGQKVLFDLIKKEDGWVLNLANLKSGLYFVQVGTEVKLITKV